MPTSKSNNRVIGITLGDPGGIGPEIVAKALASRTVRGMATYVVIGDQGLCQLPRSPNIVWHPMTAIKKWEVTVGKVSKGNGRAALSYLHTALELVRKKHIKALVTAPVSKEAIMLSDKTFIGHTELLAKSSETKSVGMMFVSDILRTIIVTRHIPIKDVSRKLTTAGVLDTIRLTHQALKKNFHIAHPRIGVCGLNPHAGENGKIGREELTTIIPAIHRARQARIRAEGPFAADTLFLPSRLKDFDCVVAMYHDQGLIPVKTLAFDKIVNLTIGLPFVRTSPAHGTAFDIAGKNQADPASMIAAIRLAGSLQ